MADYTKKLQPVAEDVLESGERLLGAVRASGRGVTRAVIGGAAGAVGGVTAAPAMGGVGAVIGSEAGAADRAEGRQEEEAAGLPPLPPQMALGLTDRRLLIFKRSALSGKPKELVAQIPRDRIEGIEGEDSGSALKPDRLTVVLIDGGQVSFEIPRADGFAPLVEAFRGG